MDYKNLEKTVETMKTNPSKSSSGKTLGWILGITLVTISIAYQRCSEYRVREIERQRQKVEYKQRQEELNSNLRNLSNEFMEEDRQRRSREVDNIIQQNAQKYLDKLKYKPDKKE